MKWLMINILHQVKYICKHNYYWDIPLLGWQKSELSNICRTLCSKHCFLLAPLIKCLKGQILSASLMKKSEPPLAKNSILGGGRGQVKNGMSHN